MRSIGERFRSQLRDLVRSERGIALPMALMITVIAMGFAAVPIVASVNSQAGDSRNQGGNEALAAAEAGAELAVLSQSELHKAEPEKLCASGSPEASGWCGVEPAAPRPIGNATYTYRVLPCYSGGSSTACAEVTSDTECTGGDGMKVVSTGVAQVGGRNVQKRVSLSGCASNFLPPTELLTKLEELEIRRTEQTETLERLERELVERKSPGIVVETKIEEISHRREALEELIFKEEAEGKTETETKTGTKTETVTHEVPAPNPFTAGALIGINYLTMNNNAQVYNGGVGTNGPVSLEGSANVCGTVRYGTTTNARNGSEGPPGGCAAGRSFVQTTPVTYPPVALPAEIATKNSDARLAAADPAGGYNRGNMNWSESKRELSVSYSTLTLEGTLPYYLCRLTLGGGSQLLAGAGKSIRIFFDDPKNCPGLNRAPQLVIANGTYVGADSHQGPGFYFVGASGAEPSTIELAGGSNVSQFVIYAPKTKIVANNGVSVSGAILGESIELGGGASVNRAGAFAPPPSSEFLAPEVKTETIVVPGTEEVRSTLSIHREELRILKEEELTEIHRLEEIYAQPPVVEKEEEVVKTSEQITTINEEIETVQTEILEWESGEAESPFEKTDFVECTAREATAGDPGSGC